MMYFLIVRDDDDSDFYVYTTSQSKTYLDEEKVKYDSEGHSYSEVVDIDQLVNRYYNDYVDLISLAFSKYKVFQVAKVSIDLISKAKGYPSGTAITLAITDDYQDESDELSDDIKLTLKHTLESMRNDYRARMMYPESASWLFVGYDMFIPAGTRSYVTIDDGQTDEELIESFELYVKIHRGNDESGFMSNNVLNFPLADPSVADSYIIGNIERKVDSRDQHLIILKLELENE